MDAQKILARLIRRMSHKDTIIRGSVSRVAEYLHLSPSTVSGWIFGNHSPSPHLIPAISELLKRDDLVLSARKCGPKMNGRKVL